MDDDRLEQADLDQLSYEQLVERLEQIVSRMAAGEIGIEEVADLYERAGRIYALAAERLERVRARIETLAPPPAPGSATAAG